MSDGLAQLAVAGFTVTVIALALSLLSLRRASSSVAIRRLDRVLLATFCMFLFVAWFFEPWVIYLCGWDGLETTECQRTLTGRLWLFYAKTFDPIFLNLPLWLRIVCSLDTILFGPFYPSPSTRFGRNSGRRGGTAHCAARVRRAALLDRRLLAGHRGGEPRVAPLGVFVINLPWTLVRSCCRAPRLPAIGRSRP